MATGIVSRVATLAAAVGVALAGCSAETAPLTPLAWQKVPGPGPGGALLGQGAAGAFDERANFTVSAFTDGGVTNLYYGGSDATGACAGINGSHWRVGLARSTDGVNFTRVPGSETGGAILDIGAPGAFDDFLAYRPFVLKDGPVYRMWYNGNRKPFNCPTGTLADARRIGYAESTDGVHWTKSYDGPGPGGSVLPMGAAGSIDEQQVGYVWVLKDGDQYKLYYSANDSGNFWRVGLAVSTDARTWTKVPGKLANGSVLDLGPAGSFDAACAYQPSVVKDRPGLYRMWYRACARPGAFGGPSGGVIGYAESNDGITWVKIPQPGPGGEALGPGAPGQFDSGGLTTPAVFADGGSWSMYYAGFDTTGQFLSGLARAPTQ
ncbi:MAG: hypothetical protein RJA59_528 [Pseudomonadota bacterium]